MREYERCSGLRSSDVAKLEPDHETTGPGLDHKGRKSHGKPVRPGELGGAVYFQRRG
jgi:hypothetical protein